MLAWGSMARLPKSCCRSSPRCRDCPVRVAAETGGREQRAGLAVLVEEVFRGAPRRPLPAPVADALACLALAQRPEHERSVLPR